MLQRDTLYITDRTSCRYIVVDYPVTQTAGDISADSLWSSTTRTIAPFPMRSKSSGYETPTLLLSGIILSFFILLIIFSRELVSSLPAVFKSLFSLKNHYKLEEKLSLSNMRNIVFVISLIYFPVIITIMADDYISSEFGIYPPLFLILFFLSLIALGIAKKLIFKLLSWLNRDKYTFAVLEKIGFNHIIVAAIVTFPSLLAKLFNPEITEETLIYAMAFSVLPVYIIYIFRSYQIIIGHRFSHFFYILYLCGAEILPIVLLAHFILSL